jgi:hypothetical protein
MKRIVALAVVAVFGVVFPAGAEAKDQYVLCGNFGGSSNPHLAQKPPGCEITHGYKAWELRSMHWDRWNNRAKGRGRINHEKHTVRLKKTRPCGQFGQFDVYSKISIDGGPWHGILYCGD